MLWEEVIKKSQKSIASAVASELLEHQKDYRFTLVVHYFSK